MTVSTVVMALSELRTSVCDDTNTGDIPVYNEYSIPDRRRPVKVLPDVNTQVAKSDSHWNSRNCCFGMCNKADSVDNEWCGVRGRPVWRHVQCRVVYTVGCKPTSGPVGTHEGEPYCKRTDQISESPVGSTEILDRVKQTVSPSRTDFVKSGIVNEPASSGDTPFE